MNLNLNKVILLASLLIALVGVALIPPPAVTQANGWTMFDYGVVCGTSSRANDINDQGQVAGWCSQETEIHAFVWTIENGLTDLGFGQASAINEKGQVVGGSGHAFLWTARAGMVDLGTLGGDYGFAYDINNLGWVVGESRTSADAIHAFLWRAGRGMIDLGTLGGNESQARGINDRGQVVGFSRIATGEWRAFLWSSRSGMVNLGSFGGESFAYDINNLGVVVGYSLDGSGSETLAFRWSAQDGIQDLGTLGGPSFAFGINDTGKIVGASYPPPPEELHGFFWSERDGMIDLGNPDNNFTEARKINSQNVVIGGASGPLGVEHVIVWVRQR